MEEKIKELKEKFEGSNKYMLTLSYEDIKELFAIIEVLKNKEPTFLIKDLYNPKLKEIELQDVNGLIEEGKKESKQEIEKYKQEIEKYKHKIEQTIRILEARPYVAYTLYGEILHESDEIAKMLKDFFKKENKNGK